MPDDETFPLFELIFAKKMDKAKLHDNSDENKRVSPKCGSKTIDLGKKCNRRELMLTPAEGQEVCCSTPFLSLSLCRLLRPPFHTFPPLQKRAFSGN